jgi:hypothetical protein
VNIDKEHLPHIFGLYPMGSNDGAYIVEFQDEKIARWYEKQGHEARKAAEPRVSASKATPYVQQDSRALPLTFERPSPSSLPMPLFQSKETSKMTSMPAQKKAPAVSVSNPPAPAQTGYEVEISGLPRHLMSRPMIEAVLDQAKLEEEILSFTLEQPDKARLCVRSQQAAESCMTHFHGRGWNAAGAGVKARMVGGWRQTSQRKSAAPKTGKSQAKASATPTTMASPWRTRLPEDVLQSEVQSKSLAHAKVPGGLMSRATGSSDASTTVSEEDREQDWWAGELSWVAPGKYGAGSY